MREPERSKFLDARVGSDAEGGPGATPRDLAQKCPLSAAFGVCGGGHLANSAVSVTDPYDGAKPPVRQGDDPRVAVLARCQTWPSYRRAHPSACILDPPVNPLLHIAQPVADTHADVNSQRAGALGTPVGQRLLGHAEKDRRFGRCQQLRACLKQSVLIAHPIPSGTTMR